MTAENETTAAVTVRWTSVDDSPPRKRIVRGNKRMKSSPTTIKNRTGANSSGSLTPGSLKRPPEIRCPLLCSSQNTTPPRTSTPMSRL